MKDVTFHFVFKGDENKLIIRKYLPDKGRAPVKLREKKIKEDELQDLKVLFESIMKRGVNW